MQALYYSYQFASDFYQGYQLYLQCQEAIKKFEQIREGNLNWQGQCEATATCASAVLSTMTGMSNFYVVQCVPGVVEVLYSLGLHSNSLVMGASNLVCNMVRGVCVDFTRFPINELICREAMRCASYALPSIRYIDPRFFCATVGGYVTTHLAQKHHASQQTNSAAKKAPPRLPDYIPAGLENDPILRQNVCDLTQSTIRFPCRLRDRNGRTYLFDKRSILDHCAKHSFINPLSQNPFQLTDLQTDRDLQVKIESRLHQLLK